MRDARSLLFKSRGDLRIAAPRLSRSCRGLRRERIFIGCTPSITWVLMQARAFSGTRSLPRRRRFRSIKSRRSSPSLRTYTEVVRDGGFMGVLDLDQLAPLEVRVRFAINSVRSSSIPSSWVSKSSRISPTPMSSAGWSSRFHCRDERGAVHARRPREPHWHAVWSSVVRRKRQFVRSFR
jgi:hypothetical protein